MTTSFELRFEWLDGAGVRDEALGRTLARLEVRVGDVCVTRAQHRRIRSVVDGVDIALFPLATWVADSLYVACGEGRRSAWLRSVRAARTERERRWHRRHGWLSHREGFAVPELVVSRADGANVRLDWLRDPPGFAPMPVRFLEDGSDVVPRDVVVEELSRLVDGVLSQCEGLESDSVRALRARWEAVQAASAADRLVLDRAARLGLDALDEGEVDDALAALLGGPIAVNEAMLDDLLDVAEAPERSRLESQLGRLGALLAEARAATAPTAIATRLGDARAALSAGRLTLPHEHGYACARLLRATALGVDDDVIGSVLDDALADRLLPRSSVCERDLDFQVRGLHGLAATAMDGAPFVALRARTLIGSRFDRARALFSLLASPVPRLVTTALDADQQASRAFAAELLAPVSYLRERLTAGVVDMDELDALAHELEVDARVVQHQIENHALAEVVAG